MTVHVESTARSMSIEALWLQWPCCFKKLNWIKSFYCHLKINKWFGTKQTRWHKRRRYIIGGQCYTLYIILHPVKSSLTCLFFTLFFKNVYIIYDGSTSTAYIPTYKIMTLAFQIYNNIRYSVARDQPVKQMWRMTLYYQVHT